GSPDRGSIPLEGLHLTFQFPQSILLFMKQTLDLQIRDIYKLDSKLVKLWSTIKSQLSPENVELFTKYETEMINLGLTPQE
ncbi:MAG: hypothetical protein EB149_06165, partial [Thaumarchaeota archaeon]|nr:hypothetical protein [Nitrososphaerota archaeon]